MQSYLFWILLTSCLPYLTIVTPHVLIDPEHDFEDRIYKTFLQPCDTVYTQVHCDEDDEDYPGERDEECVPIKTDDCDRSLQLYCHSGLCLPNCHPTLEEYDQMRGKCFRKIGTNCTKSEECDLHAVCDRRHCRCAKNYTLQLESGKCQRSSEFGESCDSEVICDMMGDVVCGVNNTCQCRDPAAQFFHPKRKRCYLRVGQDCHNKLGSFQFCPDNSDCIRILETGDIEQYIGIPGNDWEDEQRNFTCSCKNGYASNREGKACLGIYGTPCNSLHKCNTERSFKCYSSGQCQCARPKDQVFDIKLQRCVTLIGSLCDEKEGRGDNSCMIKATCRQDADKRVSTCECLPGFSLGSLDKDVCLKDHGQNCSTAIIGQLEGDDHFNEPPCNGLVGLECSNHTGSCQCKDSNQFYDVKLKNCRDFEVAQRRIPVTHYDTSDREYLFHYNQYNGKNAAADELRFSLIHFITLGLFLNLM